MCESERASYHPAWNDHYKREEKREASLAPMTRSEKGEGEREGFSIIHSGQRGRTRDPASAAKEK